MLAREGCEPWDAASRASVRVCVRALLVAFPLQTPNSDSNIFPILNWISRLLRNIVSFYWDLTKYSGTGVGGRWWLGEA